MSLGYALLHPRQLDAALVVQTEKKTFDQVFDLVCGAMGIQDVDDELLAAFSAQSEAMTEFAARFETLFEPGRPLAPLKLMASVDITDPDTLGDAVETLCTFLQTADADQVKALAIPAIDAILEVLPNLESEVVANFAIRRLDEIVAILKAPLRKGHKDLSAVKAYRAAHTLRCLLNPAYHKLAALGGTVDLKLVVRETLVALLDGLDRVDFRILREAVVGLKGQYGGLLQTVLSCAGGGAVSCGVQAMAEPSLSYADEVKAVPHTLDNGRAIWATDLTTNILNLFNLIWEVVRTRPFVDRGWDGALMIIGVVWHTVRTVLRATIPDTLNRPAMGSEADSGQEFVNWLFSDWGDAAIHLFLRLLTTLIYEAGDAPTNWALMLSARWMGYFANTFNFRIWYQFARSLWYFSEHKRRSETSSDLHKMPLGRMLMGIIPPIWALMAIVGGAIMPWDNFQVEKWGWEYGVMAGIPAVLWFVAHFWVSAAAGTGIYGSISQAGLPDVPLFVTALVGMVIMTVALGIVVGGLESSSQGLALGFLIAVPTLLGVLLLFMGGFWIWGDTSITGESGWQAFFAQFFSCVTTLMLGLLGAVIWWFIIDDGRDKHGVYDQLDADKTPYRLPFRAGESWFCGQSFHGVFSHIPSSSTAHYAVDMNEAPGKAGTAARTGIVVSATQGNPDEKSVQNDINLLHSEWADNADPGSDDERVLTYSNFVHTLERGVHARVGQFVPRGMHLTDIDSTGRSAQHHTHYSGMTAQRGEGREGLPFLFGDVSLRDFRNYPLLAWCPGKGEIEGKPLSFAFYVSNNDEAEPHPHALTLATAPAAVTVSGAAAEHGHRIRIDRSMLSGGAIPDELTLDTDVAAGHHHAVTLNRAQLIAVFRLDAPDGVATSTDHEHSHAVMGPLIYEKISFNTAEVKSDVNGEEYEHSHSLELGLDFLVRNTVPAAGLTRTMGGSTWHDHQITLTPDQVATGMALGDPDVATGGVNPATWAPAPNTVEAHTHDSIRATGIAADARDMDTRIVEPPPAQLTARSPGPYDLLGERLVVRINERATEWYFWGGQRSCSVADIAMDSGFGAGDQIRIGVGAGGTTVSMPGGPAVRESLRETVATLSQALRAAVVTTPPQPRAAPQRRIALRTDPVLVIETRQRGSGAQLERTGGSLPHSFLPAGAATVATGTGPFADLAAVPRNDFLAYVTNIVQNGWASPPAAIATSVTGNRLGVTVGGLAAVFAGSSSRIEQVAANLYDPGTTELRATGAIPLGGGRLALATGYDLPLLGTPARIEIADPGAGNTINLTVNGAAAAIGVPTAGSAAATARRIMQRVEGVRARDAGGSLIIETISAGPEARLRVSINSLDAVDAHGERPQGQAYDDLTRLSVAHLEAVIDDAVARATLPAAAGAHNLRVSPDGSRLHIEVDAPATIAASVTATAATDPVGFVAPPASPQGVVSRDLPGTLRFDGPAWIDIAVTDGSTDIVRIPIDGEPARLDIAPARLPDNGETLSLDVNGAAVTVGFDGSERSLADVAEKVATASDALLVRLAYRVTVEDMLWGEEGGDLRLDDTVSAADGLAMAGFLGPRPIAVNDRMALGEDMLAQGAAFPPPLRRAGALVDLVTVAPGVDSGGNPIMRLSGSGVAASLDIAVTPGPDPLSLASPAGSPHVLESAALAVTTDLGGTAKRFQVTARSAGGMAVAEGYAQLTAQPAVARSVRDASLPIAGPALLEIGVIEPGGSRRAAGADLSGITSLDEVAQRINAGSPQLRAWVARVSEVQHAESTQGGNRTFAERLHIETVGGGRDWRLDLGDLQTAAALGFPLSARADGLLVFHGRGNVRDGRAATRDEIASALQEIADALTGSDNPPGAGSRHRISVQVNGDTLELRSAEGQLDLVLEPASLAQRIVTDVRPDVTRLNPAPAGGGAPPATLALDSGRILIRAGGRGLAAVELFAAPAQLVGDTPIPMVLAPLVTEQLDLLKAHPLRLTINGTLHILPLVPAAIATLEDAVAFLARATDPVSGWQGDDWWIGLLDVPGTSGSKRCVIQTRHRGSTAGLSLDLAAFPTPLPANGILGFTQPATSVSGAGNVLDMDAVPVAGGPDSLQALVEDAADRGGARQAIYVAADDRSVTPPVLRLRGSLSTTTLNQTTPPADAPGAVHLTAPAGSGTASVIEDAYAGSRALEPGILEIGSDDSALSNPRAVRALFHAEPARLGPFTLAGAPAALHGQTLELSVNGSPMSAAIQAGAATTLLDVARQLEQAAGWMIRVILAPGGGAFTVETLRRGSAAALELLSAPAALTAPALTRVAGSGSIADIDAVTGADYAAVLQDGMIAERTQADRSVRDAFIRVDGSAYDPPERDLTDPDLPVHALPREYARLRSRRAGCASSLLPVTVGGAPALPAAFGLDRSLERAPAIRAAVRIPPFGERRLSGRLHIQLNENNGIPDLPPEQTVVVEVPDATYTAARLAALIHGRLFDAGIGAAQSYGDGSIMVETLAAGITGTIRIPGASTPAADQALADLLIPGGGFARGWPGAGRTGPDTRRRPGFRSALGPMRTAPHWEFTDGLAPTTATPPVRQDHSNVYTGAAGDTIAATAAALDTLLANAADPGGVTRRIGCAAVGDDGALYIEGLYDDFDLVDGVDDAGSFRPALAVDDPPRIGGTPERRVEPAAHLRRTHEPRTLRLMRDRNGNDVLAEHDDLGWVRVPADSNSGAPASISRFPPGRYLTLTRADAAKTRDYDASAETIVLAATHAEDAARPVVLQARYWLEWDDSAVLGLAAGPDGLILVRLEREIR